MPIYGKYKKSSELKVSYRGPSHAIGQNSFSIRKFMLGKILAGDILNFPFLCF